MMALLSKALFAIRPPKAIPSINSGTPTTGARDMPTPQGDHQIPAHRTVAPYAQMGISRRNEAKSLGHAQCQVCPGPITDVGLIGPVVLPSSTVVGAVDGLG